MPSQMVDPCSSAVNILRVGNLQKDDQDLLDCISLHHSPLAVLAKVEGSPASNMLTTVTASDYMLPDREFPQAYLGVPVTE